jgi:hypothetical protein
VDVVRRSRTYLSSAAAAAARNRYCALAAKCAPALFMNSFLRQLEHKKMLIFSLSQCNLTQCELRLCHLDMFSIPSRLYDGGMTSLGKGTSTIIWLLCGFHVHFNS